MNKEKSNFAVIMEKFENAANNPHCDPTDYADALTDLATACARSVLKKVIDPKSKEQTKSGKYALRDKITDAGHNPLLLRMRADLARDTRDLARLVYANDNATDLAFDTFGDLAETVEDSDLAAAAADLIGENLADGLDLMQEAACAILEEVEKQKGRDPSMPIDLERVYTVRRLKRKVWIKEADSVNGYETVETAPIREVYKSIRRAIANSRAAQADPKNGYTYLSEYIDDGDGGETQIYRRLPKYADLGGAIVDRDPSDLCGAPAGVHASDSGLYTVDRETVDIYNSTLAALNLTDRQALILRYRLQGYGYKAIATRLGVSDKAIKKTVTQIQVKATAIGFTPDLYHEMTANG